MVTTDARTRKLCTTAARGLEEYLEGAESRNGRESRHSRTLFGHRSQAWTPTPRHVRARAIAVFWHGLTAHLYAPGGAGRKRDRAAYEADFA